MTDIINENGGLKPNDRFKVKYTAADYLAIDRKATSSPSYIYHGPEPKTIKVVINRGSTMLQLSETACNMLGCEPYDYTESEKRCAAELIKCVEELGNDAHEYRHDLKIVEIPDNVDWLIEEEPVYFDEYAEYISERHREWRGE